MRLIVVVILLSIPAASALGQQNQTSAIPASTASPDSPASSTNAKPFLRGAAENAAPVSLSRPGSQSNDLQGQLESLKSYLAGRRGFIEIPPNALAGWWPGLAGSGLRFLDDRGNSNPDANGFVGVGVRNGFKVGYANGLLFRATETDPGSPDHYTGFMNVQFHYTAAQGGLNNFNGAGVKTDYFNILATSEMRTVGQKSGVTSRLFSYSNGDTMGLQSSVTQFGGYDTSGDEQTEGIRVQAQQGSASGGNSGGVFEGVVQAVDGHMLTYSSTRDENTLGEHRMIRDLDLSYGAGEIVAIADSGGSPNTVHITGAGTHWTDLGKRAHTQWNVLAAGGNVTDTTLAFCFDPLKGDGYDTCFPVNNIVDDTHLTLNLTGVGTQQNTSWPSAWPTSGAYRLYVAAWPTSVDTEAHTITAPEFSGIRAGHKIDQVLAYNMQVIGEWIAMSRHIGFPGKGGGMHIVNWGTPESPRMGFGLSIAGAFDTAFAFQGSNPQSGVPSYFATFYSEPASNIIFDSSAARAPSREISLWRARDASGAPHVMLSFHRETASTCLLDASLCVSASGVVSARQLGQAESGDYAGTISVAGATSARVDFRLPFQATPVCSLTPTSDPSQVGSYWVSTSKSSITANVRQAGNISFNYICVGNPN
jgi:hypothetical protein